jgi:hypothetical protein
MEIAPTIPAQTAIAETPIAFGGSTDSDAEGSESDGVSEQAGTSIGEPAE